MAKKDAPKPNGEGYFHLPLRTLEELLGLPESVHIVGIQKHTKEYKDNRRLRVYLKGPGLPPRGARGEVAEISPVLIQCACGNNFMTTARKSAVPCPKCWHVNETP